MSTHFDMLFSPVRIGTMELRNRLVMAPMENQYGSADGLPSRRTIEYFEARARGGVGLITLGASSVDARHKEVRSSLHFGDDSVIEAHRALTDAVHAHGAKIQPQLVHAGPDGLGPELCGVEGLGPSVIQCYLTGTPSKAITPEEFRQVTDLFRAAATRVRHAGYDGLELHAAHGYMLLGSFLTPWRNARRDEYSGRKGDGRIRAVVEVLQAIRTEVGPDFPITLRISGYERIAGGRDSFDTQRIAPRLTAAGVDAFHVSGGVIDRFVTQMVNGASDPDALNVAAAAAVKRVVDVPVIAVGRIHDPVLAEQILREGNADLIAMGRPLLADPDLPAKVRNGRLAELRRCISCENCIDTMELRFAMDCAVNPRTGREAEFAIRPVRRSKHVIVVGGGPGGLEATRVAAERGHRVSLYERNHYLGGALLLAATVHPQNQPFLEYLLRELRRLRVRPHLGIEISLKAIETLQPDAVIVATGGHLITPTLPGDDLPHVITGGELRGLLTGRLPAKARHRLPFWPRIGLRTVGRILQPWLQPSRLRALTRVWMPLGHRIVIIGADLAAVELAEFLAEQGRQVSLLETAEEIAPEAGPKRRGEHMRQLDRAGIPVNTAVTIDRITPDGVVLQRGSGGEHQVAADSVILAGTLAPDMRLYDALSAHVPEICAIGDCTGPGLIRKAVLEGARAACAL